MCARGGAGVWLEGWGGRHAEAIQTIMPAGEAQRGKKRRTDTQGGQTSKTAKVAKAAEAAAAATAAQDSSEDSEGEVEGDDEGDDEAESGEELGEEEQIKGGGDDVALLTTLNENQERFDYEVTENEDCTVSRVVFTRDGEEIVFNRPEDEKSDEWLMWRLMEKGRIAAKRSKTLHTHLCEVAKIMEPYTSNSNKLRQATSLSAMPPRIHWKIKTLPDRILKEIDGKYFLTLDQTISNVHGMKYCAKDEDTGSMCATTGFPHAIAYQRDRGRNKGKSSMEYVVGSCNSIKLTVRLKKRTTTRPTENQLEEADVEEIKKLIASAHTMSDMDKWGHHESSVLLYLGLEFASADDGVFKPVPSSAFSKTPAFNALFAPAESPPYANGHYEFEMLGSKAVLGQKKGFKMARNASTANLKKEYKGRLFRFVIKTLNPFLCGLSGFTVRSLPFVIKGVLHNDARSQERFVETEDGIVASSPSDAPAVA